MSSCRYLQFFFIFFFLDQSSALNFYVYIQHQSSTSFLAKYISIPQLFVSLCVYLQQAFFITCFPHHAVQFRWFWKDIVGRMTFTLAYHSTNFRFSATWTHIYSTQRLLLFGFVIYFFFVRIIFPCVVFVIWMTFFVTYQYAQLFTVRM